VVVKIIAEQLDLGDGLVTSVGMGEMPGKEDKSDIANILCLGKSGNMADLERRLAIGVQDLRGPLDGRLSSGVDKFLKEDFAKDAVRLFLKNDTEDYSDTIDTWDDIDGFLWSIVHSHDFRSEYRDILRRVCLELLLDGKGTFKQCSKGVAFEKRQ